MPEADQTTPEPDATSAGVFSGYGIASAVLGVLSVVAVVLGALVWSGHRDATDERAYQTRVLAAAADWTGVLINMNVDNVDASLGEDYEAYQVDIFADGTYATVKRTLDATSPAVTYSSAMQAADFGGNQSTLYLKVYQLSSSVGRGYPLTQSITR